MKKYIAPGLLFTLISTASSLIHAEDCCLPQYTPGEPLCPDQSCAVYSAYAGTELNCGWDVFGFGEFLYWSPVRETALVALTFEGNPLGNTQRELAHKFGYRPAFRVGLGMVLHNFDDWIFNIDYFRYHHSFKKTFSVVLPNQITSTVGLLNAPIYSSLQDKSQFHYDIVGVSIQRPNYLGQNVILSPFLGFKWLKRDDKMSQELRRSGTNLTDRQESTLSYSSIGIGAGFDGYWLLCYGLYLIGKADVAILYPYDRKKNVQTVTAVEGITNVNVHLKHVDIYGKGGMGVGWGSYFCCNRYHVDLSASYDFMAEVLKLAATSGMFFEPSNLLMGLTIHAQFDF